jgi:ribonuclease HI
MITIYTDGSSRGNPGPGGWGAIIMDGDKVKEIGGRENKTTNNRMEMMASIEALSKTLEGTEVELHTDSNYLINGITKWVHSWAKNGWVTKTKEDVLNKDLWIRLKAETDTRKVTWQKVAGHSGHVFNDRCDEIATEFADSIHNQKNIKLYSGPSMTYEVIDREPKPAVQKSKGKSGKAYSYVSKVNGVIQVDKTWAECEARVKGVKGARFRKALSPEEERQIIQEFQ